MRESVYSEDLLKDPLLSVSYPYVSKKGRVGFLSAIPLRATKGVCLGFSEFAGKNADQLGIIG